MSALLEIKDLEAGYGNRTVLRGVTLEVSASEIFLLIGHNGAGKTTLLSAIVGLIRPTRGSVAISGVPLGISPAVAVRQKVSYSPAGNGNVLRRLSVHENLQIAAEGAGAKKRDLQQLLDATYQIFPSLGNRPRLLAGQLSGGQQRMLSVGMALAQDPQLLLLDEPSLGLAPKPVEELFGTLSETAKKAGIAVLLVEQNINLSSMPFDRFGVLRMGEFVRSGSAEELRADSSALLGLL